MRGTRDPSALATTAHSAVAAGVIEEAVPFAWGTDSNGGCGPDTGPGAMAGQQNGSRA